MNLSSRTTDLVHAAQHLRHPPPIHTRSNVWWCYLGTGRLLRKTKPRTFLTNLRIHVHNQQRYNDYMDLLVLDTDMSDLIGDPCQASNSAYWTHTEMGQPASHIPQDLYPSVSTVQLNSNLQQLPQPSVPSVPSFRYDTQDYSQLVGTNFQPSEWNPALWDQSYQNAIPSVQQGQPILTHNVHGGATHVAPQLSMTDATSDYLSPEQQSQSTPAQSRHTSATSSPSSAFEYQILEVSRSVSPNPNTLTVYGFKDPDNSWSCAWPGCTSRTRFTRACDLRKHYKRHSKTLFCRYNGCPQSREAGFSSKKDRARHETKHNPMIMCEWEDCGRLFGRVDNMVRCHFHHLTSPTCYEASC